MPGFRRVKAHGKAPHSQHRVQRQVAQEFITGETLHGLAKRHDVSRNLIRIWVRKIRSRRLRRRCSRRRLIQEYEARIAALGRLVGKQALELEFPKGDYANSQFHHSRDGTIFTCLFA